MAIAAIDIQTLVEEVNGHPFPMMFITCGEPLEEFERRCGFAWEAWFRHMGWKGQRETDEPPICNRWFIGVTEDQMHIHDRKVHEPMFFGRPREEWVEAARQAQVVMVFVVTDATEVTEVDGGLYAKDNCIGALVRVNVEPTGLR